MGQSSTVDLIESYPGPPQHEETNDGIAGTAHGRLPHLVPPAHARSQHDRRHQSSHSTHQVNSTAPGHVNYSQATEESGLRPEPAGRDTEDEGVEEREENVEIEIGPLRHRARYDGCPFIIVRNL